MSAPNITQARCVLVLGATAGIGRALALAIHDLPSKPTVIVGGRRQERLNELVNQGERIKAVNVDVTMPRSSLQKFVTDILETYPDLDAVIYSSGVQHQFDFRQPDKIDLDLVEQEINTNYLSFVTLTKYIMPHFLKLSDQGRPSFLVPISSGLAIIPGSPVPNYSATKAGIHSLSLSLSLQLKDTKVRVLEILPPLTESELHDHQGITETISKFWMPLDEFTKHAMAGLIRGDIQIGVGRSEQAWDLYERGKLAEMGLTNDN